jgi:hypothetical protein
MAERQTSRDVSAREAVEAVRSELSNVELMERFKISAQGFADLLRQLFEKRLISEEDLAARGIRFRVVRKEVIPEPPQVVSPQPIEHDEEFLDTVELTELLSFKPGQFESFPKKSEPPPPPPPPPPADEEPKAPAKKGKFSLSKLFKKDR